MNCQNYMMNTSALEKNRLLTKKDLLDIIINDPDLSIDNFKKMKVNDIRDILKITHTIDGHYRNMSGYCFSCLTPLRADYTRNKNYCIDC